MSTEHFIKEDTSISDKSVNVRNDLVDFSHFLHTCQMCSFDPLINKMQFLLNLKSM